VRRSVGHGACGSIGFNVETPPHFEDALAHPDVQAVILCTPQERHAD
jgi:predicted dehydrogenase